MALKRRRVRRIKTPEKCFFCEEKLTPDYKDHEKLAGFVTDRAKIVGRKRTGVCSKHQRRLTMEVKRARHLGLLPFTDRL
jgi:small subunit ribosomal protein S18